MQENEHRKSLVFVWGFQSSGLGDIYMVWASIFFFLRPRLGDKILAGGQHLLMIFNES